MSQNALQTFTGGLPPEVLLQVTTDSGVAVPAANNLNLIGGNDISTSASGDTVTITFTGSTSGVSSVTGTSPIQVNGVSGTPQTGAVTVSLLGGQPINTIAGDVGSVSGSTVTIDAGLSTQNSGSTVSFTANSATELLFNVTDALSNTIIGNEAGNATISGGSNVALGQLNLSTASTAANNTAIGTQALSSASTASSNSALGALALESITSGSNNIGIGVAAGINYVTSDSSNIAIGNRGTAAESNTIRIGTQGSSTAQQNRCFVAGIVGVSVSNQTITTINSSTGQLGNVTLVPVANGGTGAATLTGVLIGNGTSAVTGNPITQHSVLLGGAGNAITSLTNGTSGQVLTAISGSNPTWTSIVTGVSSVTGTANQILASPTTGAVILSLIGPYTPATYTAHGILIGEGTSSIVAVAPNSTSGIPFISQGSSADPAYGTAVVQGGGTGATTLTGVLIGNGTSAVTGNPITNHSVLVGGSSNAITSIANGTTGQILTANTGADPSWSTLSTGVSSVTGTANQILASPTTGAVVLSLIGPYTPATYTANGILIGEGTSSIVAVPPNSTSGIPFISQGTGSDPAYGTAVVQGGGTGSTSFNINGAVFSNTTTTDVLQAATLSSGQLLIGGTTTPAAANLTGGTGISIVNGNNSITINSTGAGFTWHDVTAGSATLAAQNGYIADKNTLTTFTLPTNNAIGDTIVIVGKGSGGWKIQYTTGQNIIFGAMTSTTSTGNIASTQANDCCWLVCVTASASSPLFTIINAIGNLTVS